MENKKAMIFGSVLLAGVLIFSLYGMSTSIASGKFERMDDEYEHEYDEDKYSKRRQGMSQTNALYIEECGSCHMAYPARLLPAQSWSKMMNGLDDHFGENAELDNESRNSIERYLVQSTLAGKGKYRKMLRNLGSKMPLRITELPYFVHEHDEMPSRFIRGNDKVSSLSQCNACHQGAEKGWFDEDDVVIPGVGRWDD